MGAAVSALKYTLHIHASVDLKEWQLSIAITFLSSTDYCLHAGRVGSVVAGAGGARLSVQIGVSATVSSL